MAEATKRGGLAVKALSGELEPAPKKSKLKGFAKFLAIGAVVAGAVAAVRHFLAPKDDGWTAHEPSKAYVNNNDTFSNAAKFAADVPADEPADDPIIVTEDEVQDHTDMTAEGAPPVDKLVVDDEPLEADSAAGDVVSEAAAGYGDGSYVGDNPPEGFNIKGNERSKKYHVEGTGGYERTIAEVWFNSEDAAQAAGFTKAQR